MRGVRYAGHPVSFEKKKDKGMPSIDHRNKEHIEESKFSQSRLRRGLDAFGNMFAINVLFVLTSLPIFTIGASLTAAYSMSMRLQEDKEETVLAGYLSEFRRNFKQSTLTFLIIVAAGGIMYAEFLVAQMQGQSSMLGQFYTAVLILETIGMTLLLPFLFPLIAAYENSFWMTFKNAFYMSIGYTWSAVKIIVAWAAPVIICLVYPVIFITIWYLWLLLIFGAVIWGTSHTVRSVLRKNNKALENKKEESSGKSDGSEKTVKDDAEDIQSAK